MPLISILFRGDSALEACLTSDPAHVVPGSSGVHVAKIQQALRTLGPSQIDSAELGQARYGSTTAAAVLAFKRDYALLNFQNQLDDIVGKKTIAKLDELMAARDKPIPPTPVPSIVGSAGVQLGPLGHREDIVARYYRGCGLETVGPGQVTTSGLQRYSTMEGLIDLLLARSEPQQVIVNHGDPDSGLLVPFCKETAYRATGSVMYLFSGLADLAQKGPINPSAPSAKVLLGVAVDLKVSQAVVLRIVDKLVLLRKKQLVLHFRACNLTDQTMVGAYKRAFGARLITYHGCRLLFVVIRPQQLKEGLTASGVFASKSGSTRDRYRLFDDPIGLLSSLVVEVRDVDGHTVVEDFSVIELRNAEQVGGWAEFLVRRWSPASTLDFVVPIMWDNHETTYHCPLEPGWRQKLQSL